MGYLVKSPFSEGLSSDTVRRQYIIQVRSKWRSETPFGFVTLVVTIAEAYMAAGYQPKEVQNASRSMGDTTSAAVWGPLPMTLLPNLTSIMAPSNPMHTPHIDPMPTPSAAPLPLTVPQPMHLSTIAKLGDERHAYIGERRNN